MHQKVCLAFFCLLLVSNGRLEGGGGGLEPPLVPLRLLAGSLIEGCSICAESDTKKAFSMLGREYPPAAVFSSGPECAFIRPPNAVRASSFSRAIRPASPTRGRAAKKARFRCSSSGSTRRAITWWALPPGTLPPRTSRQRSVR
jgi:hypothetical protein